MMPKSLLWMLFCFTLCRQVPAWADEPKAADEVIAKYVEAIGGQAVLDSVRSMRMTGRNVVAGGMEIPLTMEMKRPNKVRVEFTMQGMTGVQAYDGETGWFVMPFMGKTDPEKMSPEQVELLADRGDIVGPLVGYKEKGHRVELIGKEEFEGSETYKLRLTRKDGTVEYHYLDAEHFLPIKVEGKRRFQGAEIEFEAAPGDYKEVGGLLIAHSIQSSAGPMGGSTLTFEKVEVNVDLPDDRFAMPEIKKAETTTMPADTDQGEKEDEVEIKDEG